jgi:predicted 3-demethylubiquinone-9 3-methyltransferase (glyoxalase superfamily)
MAKDASPFLMFQDGNAEEAMTFYVSLFPNSRIDNVKRFAPGMPGPEGKVMMAAFTLLGRPFVCSDSPIKHDFDFTPSISIYIDCASEAEVDGLAAQLGEGGFALMPPGNYGFSKHFAWISDRYKVTWQLNFVG